MKYFELNVSFLECNLIKLQILGQLAFQSSELLEYSFEDRENISNVIGQELDNILANQFHPYMTLQILFLDEDITKTFRTLHFQLNFRKTNLTEIDSEDVTQLYKILLASTNKTLLRRRERKSVDATTQTQLEQNSTAANNQTNIRDINRV